MPPSKPEDKIQWIDVCLFREENSVLNHRFEWNAPREAFYCCRWISDFATGLSVEVLTTFSEAGECGEISPGSISLSIP